MLESIPTYRVKIHGLPIFIKQALLQINTYNLNIGEAEKEKELLEI